LYSLPRPARPGFTFRIATPADALCIGVLGEHAQHDNPPFLKALGGAPPTGACRAARR
jgi:hypothetical protein